MLESIEDFENTLNELSTLKPPGVSGSRIKNLKDYFLSHVDEEDKLVNLLINCCISIPVSNKLGPLYVVDSVVRSLIDEIGSNSIVDNNSPNGTASSAIHKFQLNIENLLNDAIPNSNDDVKDKILKLIEIWLNCSTFNKEILLKIKDKFYKSFTPPGTPPNKKVEIETKQPAKDPTSVLQALANLAKNTPSPSSINNANTKLASPNQEIIPPSTSNVNSKPNANPTNNSSTSSNPNAIFQLLQNMNKMSNTNATNTTTSNNNNNQQFNNSSDNFRDRSDRNRNSTSNDRRRDRSPNRNVSNNDEDSAIDGEQNIPSNPHYRIKKSFIDPTIPQGYINVYSRTIFIGGVPQSMNEHQLVQTLKPYAEVQSVIINTSRKHAFVKVYSRSEADQVIQAFSVSHPSGLRARWGVGFGPRDCCNYQTGISTIPIQRLTDADKKWIISAQWGGSTPDLPLQSGLFVEEPDIEVGHGVSSKSISRKMPTNSSHNGPKSDGSNNNNNRYNNNNNNGRFNPNHMPLNYGNQMNMPPQQQYGYLPQPQPQPQQFGGYPNPNMGSPQQQFNQPPLNQYNQLPPPPPQQQQQFGQTQHLPPSSAGQQLPQMDQNQMMAAMMAAMTQMQKGGQNQGGAPVDMNNMMQVMANMMGQQGNGMNGMGGQPPSQ